MSELTNQSGDVGNDRLLQQGEATHDGCKDPKSRSEELKSESIPLTERTKESLPFMMYSFSVDPGRARALNKLVSSCSVKGAISAGVILKHKTG